MKPPNRVPNKQKLNKIPFLSYDKTVTVHVTGPKGSGKTTVGNFIARKLHDAGAQVWMDSCSHGGMKTRMRFEKGPTYPEIPISYDWRGRDVVVSDMGDFDVEDEKTSLRREVHLLRERIAQLEKLVEDEYALPV